MGEIKYTEDHEWICIDGEVGTVGITNFAQEQLGDIVYVELPETGANVGKGDQVAVVESVKAASEICAPVGGDVVEANGGLEGAPDTVNADAKSGGWFFKIKITDASELDSLMDKEAYKAFIA